MFTPRCRKRGWARGVEMIDAHIFEIAARGGCAARRQQEAGFVRTQTGGLGGYTARIAKAGLSAAQVTISK